MEQTTESKDNGCVHMEDSKPDAVLAISKQVANYEDAQHMQTKTAAIKENWKGIMWCL